MFKIKKTKIILLFVILFLGLFGLAKGSQAANWHVCATPSGAATGVDWANCWGYASVFQSSSKWCSTAIWPKVGCANLIGAGDNVYLDGGASPSGVTYALTNTNGPYHSAFETFQNGYSMAHRITIGLDPSDASHNFKVIIDGQRDSTLLAPLFVIRNDFILLDGHVGSDPTYRIILKNGYSSGLQFDGSTVGHPNNGSTAAYLELYNNGFGDPSPNVDIYQPKEFPNPATPVEVSHCYLHDPWRTSQDLLHGQNMRINNPYYNSVEIIPAAYGSYLIHHNIFKNADEDQIETSAGSVDFYNNEVYNDPTVRWYDGLHGFAAYYRIYNNYIHGQRDGNPLYFEPHQSILGIGNPLTHIMVYNNLFVSDQTTFAGPVDGISFGGATTTIGDQTAGYNNIYVLNNTFVNYRGYAIHWLSANPSGTNSSNVSNFIIANNIIQNGYCTGSSGSPTYCGSSAAGFGDKGDGTVTFGGWGSGANVIVDYNLFWATDSGWGTNLIFNGSTYSYSNFKSVCTYGGIACQAHDQSSPVDPKFVSTSNFNLQSSSPAIDHGIDLHTQLSCTNGSTCVDYAQLARPQGAAWDIGAYEYVSGSSDTTPPAAPQGLAVQ